jgi:exopolysaccharide biosynthesis predicted pyruvyltransferase EpsI
MTDSTALCAQFKDKILESLKPYGMAPNEVALLDFPGHGNVGDSAIWMGALDYFTAALGRRPAYVCDVRHHCDNEVLEKAAPDCTIFLQGGGNFGDLWAKHHAFRESILARFRGRRVIQLPQTIHFTNANALGKTAKAIESHGNFILFVRDHRSFEIATSTFMCPVHLVPDMAFCMGARRRPVAATHPLLMLLRRDIESGRPEANRAFTPPEGAVVADWLQDDATFFWKKQLYRSLTGAAELMVRSANRSRYRELRYRNYANSRVNRGLNLLSSASFVITDRLHGHILCMLLGIPHIVFDNSYGKLGSFIETWTKDCGLVQVEPSLDHAIARWSELQSNDEDKRGRSPRHSPHDVRH